VEPADVRMNKDILHLLTRAAAQCKERVLIMEDDFEWCPNSHYHLSHVLRSVDVLFPGWGAGRIGFGMNGVLMNCEQLMSAHVFLKTNLLLGPADSMLGMLWTNDKELANSGDFGMPLDAKGSKFTGRTYWAYRYNLMAHIGVDTSREGTDFPAPTLLPRCYDINTMNGIMDLEQFDLMRCGGQDFSPCPPNGPKVAPLLEPIAALWPASITTRFDALHVGGKGESCNSVCKKVGKRCSLPVMPLINNCVLLRK